MASEITSCLKQKLMEMPDEFFEPLIFGEIEIGQKFIALPLPGDSRGHGGFKGTHYIFTKTAQSIDATEAGRRFGIPYELPGRATNNKDALNSFDDSMPVILVE